MKHLFWLWKNRNNPRLILLKTVAVAVTDKDTLCIINNEYNNVDLEYAAQSINIKATGALSSELYLLEEK